MPNVPFTAIYPDGPAGSAAAAGGDPGGVGGGNLLYPGLPVGAVPFHNDVVIATATTTTLWQPAPGRRFVVTRLFVTTDVAQTVTIYDGLNIAGRRVLRAPFAANGGTDPNGWPASYVAKLAGSALLVDNTGAGVLWVAVDGYEMEG